MCLEAYLGTPRSYKKTWHMIISTKQKLRSRTWRPDLWLPGGGGEGVGWTGILGLVDANYNIKNGWAEGYYHAIQGTMCNWVTLLYNRN